MTGFFRAKIVGFCPFLEFSLLSAANI